MSQEEFFKQSEAGELGERGAGGMHQARAEAARSGAGEMDPMLCSQGLPYGAERTEDTPPTSTPHPSPVSLNTALFPQAPRTLHL